MGTNLTALTAWLDQYAADKAAYAADTRDKFGNGGKRAEYRRRLFAFQHGVCVKCGGTMSLEAAPGTDERAEWSHLRTARRFGSVRAGFRWGNLTLWHMRCNRSFGENDVNLATDLNRADLIFWGNTRELPMA